MQQLSRITKQEFSPSQCQYRESRQRVLHPSHAIFTIKVQRTRILHYSVRLISSLGVYLGDLTTMNEPRQWQSGDRVKIGWLRGCSEVLCAVDAVMGPTWATV